MFLTYYVKRVAEVQNLKIVVSPELGARLGGVITTVGVGIGGDRDREQYSVRSFALRHNVCDFLLGEHWIVVSRNKKGAVWGYVLAPSDGAQLRKFFSSSLALLLHFSESTVQEVFIICPTLRNRYVSGGIQEQSSAHPDFDRRSLADVPKR